MLSLSLILGTKALPDVDRAVSPNLLPNLLPYLQPLTGKRSFCQRGGASQPITAAAQPLPCRSDHDTTWKSCAA
jgi:hypothetical protein